MFNYLSKKQLLFLIATIGIFIAVPLTLSQLKKQQEIRGRAGGQSVTLVLIPATATKNVNEEFNVQVKIETNGNSVKGIDAGVILDTTVLDFVSFTPSLAFNDILRNTFDQNTGMLRVSAVDTTTTQYAQAFTIGILRLKAKAPGTAAVSFSPNGLFIVALHQQGNLQTANNTVGSYTVTAPTPSPTIAPLTASLSFLPSTHTSELTTTFTAIFKLDAGSNNISGVDITALYNKDVLSLTSFTPASLFGTQLTNDINETTGTLHYAAVDTQNARNGALTLGTLTFRPRTVGQATVDVTNAVITALGQNNPLNVVKSLATYTIIETLPTPTAAQQVTCTCDIPGGAAPNNRFQCSDGDVRYCAENEICTNTSVKPLFPCQAVTPTPTVTAAPTLTPTLLPTATTVPQPTVTFTPGGTALTISLTLPGIGSSENQRPVRPQPTLTLSLHDTSGIKAAEKSQIITYNSNTGKFTGTFDMGVVPQGSYSVKAKMSGFLTKLVQSILDIPQGGGRFQISGTPKMTAGDINEDNKIDIMDYQHIISCYGGKANTSSCTAKEIATQTANNTTYKVDFNSDGVIDGIDYAIFIRGLAVRSGD